MAIKLNVVDNNSEVRVRPSTKDVVPAKPNSGIDNARYEALVNKERQERIAADELLQSTKQDLGYIPVEPYLVEGQVYGIFPEAVLEKLKKYLVNKISFGNYIYSLSVSNGNLKTYFCARGDIAVNKIDVNFSTGVFTLVRANEHMVTEEQMRFWDNKVTAYSIDRQADSGDKYHDGYNNTLVLDKNNYIDGNGNIVNKGE